MSTGDLDDLTALWRVEPEPAEREELERLADKARRRGKLADVVDLALVAVLVVVSIVAAFAAQNPLLLIAAVLLIIASIWLTLKRRAIRQMAQSLSASDRSGYVESSIRNVRSNLRRNAVTLIVFPFIAPLALLVKLGTRTADPGEIVMGLFAWAASQRGLITLTVVFLIMAFLVRARRRHRAELRRLQELQHAYEDEARRDAQADL